MARIRTVKPEFWSSPNLPPDPWERLLYVAMWNWADDDGRGTANARELMGFAFPNEDWMTLVDFRRMLGGVRRAFGVKFYSVEGRPYFEVQTWDKHQKIDKRAKSRHPGPDEGEDFNPDPDQQEHPSSEEPPETPPSPRRDAGAGTGEQGNRGTGEVKDAQPSAARGQTAQTLLAEWIDNCSAPPVGRVKGQVAKLLGELLGEGVAYETVRAGLQRWHQKRLNPAALPSVVHEVAQGPALRAVGSHQPYRNPSDQSVYDEPLEAS